MADYLNMEDATIRVSVLSKLTGEAVNLTDYVAYGIILTLRTVVQKYMSETVTGYKGITVVAPESGVFDIDVFREDLERCGEGNVFGQVIAYKTDSDFKDDKMVSIGDPALMFTNRINKYITSTTGY